MDSISRKHSMFKPMNKATEKYNPGLNIHCFKIRINVYPDPSYPNLNRSCIGTIMHQLSKWETNAAYLRIVIDFWIFSCQYWGRQPRVKEIAHTIDEDHLVNFMRNLRTVWGNFILMKRSMLIKVTKKTGASLDVKKLVSLQSCR